MGQKEEIEWEKHSHKNAMQKRKRNGKRGRETEVDLGETQRCPAPELVPPYK
jgi:hypothetical protein